MVYERYIRKNGKLYGPYTYHSKKENGKVVSEYLGKKKSSVKSPKALLNRAKNIFGKKSIMVFLPVLFLVFAVAILFSFQGTGNVVLDLDQAYNSGDKLSGGLKFILSESEFLPANSELIINNSGVSESYFLGDLVEDEKGEGDFFVNNVDLNGSGLGFGVDSENSVVSFVLEIYGFVEADENEGDSSFGSGSSDLLTEVDWNWR